MPDSRPVAHQLTMTNTQGNPQVAQLMILLHEFKSLSVRIDVGPFATLLRRWKFGYGTCQRVLTEELGMHRVAAKFVPRILTADQKQQRINVCTELHQLASDDETFLSRVITGDESWVMTLRQSNNPHSGKAPHHQGQKRPDR